MKTLSISLIAILFVSLIASCKKNSSNSNQPSTHEDSLAILYPFQIKKGTELIYEVENGDVKYNFIVFITAASDAGIDFTWKMTDPINYAGKISITESALKYANKLYNYFNDGEEVNLTNSTSVFLSSRLYDEFVKEERAYVNFGFGEDLLILRAKPQDHFKYQFLMNGKQSEIEMLDANCSMPDRVLRFAKVGDYVLILEMLSDFWISLKEVNTNVK